MVHLTTIKGGATLAFRQLRKGDLIPSAEVEEILTQSVGRMTMEMEEEKREEIRSEVKQRFEAVPLLRWWDKGIDFLNEAMRHYYAAKYLSTWDIEEITALLNEAAWNKVWPHLFSTLEERDKAERLLEEMLERGHLTLALDCYLHRRDRLGVINERLKEQLLRHARYALRTTNEDIQRIFLELASRDPSSDVRQTVLRTLTLDYLPHISHTVVKILLDALDDPVRNCQRAAISSLIGIAQKKGFPSETVPLVERKVREHLEVIKDSLEKEEDLWPDLVVLLNYIGNSSETIELLKEIDEKVRSESQWESVRELVQRAIHSVEERMS